MEVTSTSPISTPELAANLPMAAVPAPNTGTAGKIAPSAPRTWTGRTLLVADLPLFAGDKSFKITVILDTISLTKPLKYCCIVPLASVSTAEPDVVPRAAFAIGSVTGNPLSAEVIPVNAPTLTLVSSEAFLSSTAPISTSPVRVTILELLELVDSPCSENPTCTSTKTVPDVEINLNLSIGVLRN